MIRLEPLTGHHNRNGFECGVEALNVWLNQTALQHQCRGVSRTIVAVPSSRDVVDTCRKIGYDGFDATTILGFYALASAFILIEDLAPELAKRFPREVPVTRLGRLAARAELQHQGLGQLLLSDAIGRARNAAQSVGSAGIIVDAKGDAAVRFYLRYGFQPWGTRPLKLFLAMW